MALVPSMVMLLGRQSASLQSTLSTRFLRLLACSTKCAVLSIQAAWSGMLQQQQRRTPTATVNMHQHWIGSAIIGEPVVASLQLQPYILPVGMSVS